MKRKRASTPSFITEFGEQGLFSSAMKLVPNLTIKYRGRMIQLRGAKVPADDFTKFVKRGDSFRPVMVEAPVHGEEVYDLAPLLSIGVAEFMVMLGHGTCTSSRDYLSWCHNLEFGRNWASILDKAREYIDGDDSEMTILATTVRSSLIDGRFPAIRQIYRTLMALKVMNPTSYCMALMEAIHTIFPTMLCYINDDMFDELKKRHYGGEDFMYMGVVVRKLLKFGAIPYGSWRSKSTISDCRGLGICLLCLYTMDVYNKFATFESNNIPDMLQSWSSYSRLRGTFNSCIGTDAVGRYMHGYGWEDAEVDESISVLAEQAGAPSLDCHIPDTMTLVPTDSGIAFIDAFWYAVAGKEYTHLPVGRGLCESSMLWCHATGLETRRLRGYVAPMDCYYATKRDIVRTFMDFAFSKRGVRLQDKLEHVNHEALMKELMERVGAQRIRDKVAREAEAKARSEVEDLKRKISVMNVELDSVWSAKKESDNLVVMKQDTIDRLRAELDDLRAKVHNMYDVEEQEAEDGVVDDSVSVDEMLALVNQFRLIVVGGIDSLRFRLENAGFTNFCICASKYQSGSMDVVGDFYCICTKFISHKDAAYVESKHGDQLDQFFYFNGTNAEVLLRTCYQFMKGWFKSENGQMNKRESCV